MSRYDQIYTRQLKKVNYEIRFSDFDLPFINKLKKGKVGDEEVDGDYGWLLNYLFETAKVAIKRKDRNELENENDNEDEDVDEQDNQNENKNEYEDVDVDENDKDPQYCMFLENLTEHGKAYKLKISENDEEPHFLYYEEPDDSDWVDEHQTSIDSSGDELSEELQICLKAKMRLNEKKRMSSTKKEVSRRKSSIKKEVSRRKKTNDHKSTTQPHQGINVDSCYQTHLNGYAVPFELVAVKSEENLEECEKNVTTSESDSDLIILDNIQNCSEANNKELVLAEKEPSLKKKLMDILKQPYDEKEYEELSVYVEQKKPMCRHLDLRGRPISFAYGVVKKSVLDDGPRSFRKALNAAQNDPPKALNLLRMFRFWLEHAPNENLFAPWIDEELLKVLPSEKKSLRSKSEMLHLDK